MGHWFLWRIGAHIVAFLGTKLSARLQAFRYTEAGMVRKYRFRSKTPQNKVCSERWYKLFMIYFEHCQPWSLPVLSNQLLYPTHFLIRPTDGLKKTKESPHTCMCER
jgi:hypothetical protein